MSSNVCGNCANFKPKQGDKFFNCTYAKQGGVSYGMQVRADTRSCEAFSPLKQPANAKAAPPPPTSRKETPPPTRLCNWGRLILIAAIIIIILLIAWGIYSCASGGEAPTPTPTPTGAPTPTGITPTPIPTATPIPVYYYSFGDLVTTPDWQVVITQPTWTYQYHAPGPIDAKPGTIFLIVPVTVWNVGTNVFNIAATDFQLVSSDTGAIYGAIPPPLSINFQTPFPYYKYTVYPSGRVTGVILYNPPAGATNLRIQILAHNQYYVVWNVPNHT